MQHRTGEPVTSGETCDRTLSYFSVREWLTMSHIFKTLCKLSLQQLAGRSFWNVFDEVHGFWALVVSQMLFAEIDDLGFTHRLRVFQNDEGCDLFSVKPVRHADHRGCRDGRMSIKKIIYFARINILAGANDHVRLTIGDVEKAVGITVADVA